MVFLMWAVGCDAVGMVTARNAAPAEGLRLMVRPRLNASCAAVPIYATAENLQDQSSQLRDIATQYLPQ